MPAITHPGRPSDQQAAIEMWANRRLSVLERIRLAVLNSRIRRAERRARLTDAERERMEVWLIEHHEFEPDDYEWEF